MNTQIVRKRKRDEARMGDQTEIDSCEEDQLGRRIRRTGSREALTKSVHPTQKSVVGIAGRAARPDVQPMHPSEGRASYVERVRFIVFKVSSLTGNCPSPLVGGLVDHTSRCGSKKTFRMVIGYRARSLLNTWINTGNTFPRSSMADLSDGRHLSTISRTQS